MQRSVQWMAKRPTYIKRCNWNNFRKRHYCILTSAYFLPCLHIPYLPILKKLYIKKMHKNWTFRQSLLFVHCISSWFTVFFYRLFIAEKFKFFGRQPCFGTHCRNFSYLSLFSLITLCDSFLLKAYVFDIRNSAYLHRLPGQSDVISCVNFCPQTPMVFISFSS